MRPNYGEIVSLDHTKLVKIDEDTQFDYKYTGQTVTAPNGERCATFVDDKGGVFMQTWRHAGYFRRFGEKNIGAFLKNEQVIEMLRAYHLDGAKIPDLSLKYNITEKHIKMIVTGKAWRHMTPRLIFQLRNGGQVPVVANNRPKGRRKLSEAIVPFIRKDSTVNKMSVPALAIKYCVSRSQIRRILSGKAWAERTDA